MIKYIVRRALCLIPVILLLSMILFLIMKGMPGDPVSAYFGVGSRATAEQQERVRQMMGLDRPLAVQYAKWLWNCLRGDFGESSLFKKPVAEAVGPLILNSFRLHAAAFAAALAVAVPVGIRSAVRKNSLYDHAWSAFSLAGVSLPSFFFGLLLIYLFAVALHWLPVNGMVTAGRQHASWWRRELDIARHMILPAAVLAIGMLAGMIRIVRNSMLDVLGQDYILTARARGLSERAVVYRHAFRNALLPLITLLGLSVPALFSGSVILETVFVWPGIGKALYDALGSRDYGLIMACNTVFAALLLGGNLLADIGYALADPRIRYGKGGPS